jgi:hypothetical protein
VPVFPVSSITAPAAAASRIALSSVRRLTPVWRASFRRLRETTLPPFACTASRSPDKPRLRGAGSSSSSLRFARRLAGRIGAGLARALR